MSTAGDLRGNEAAFPIPPMFVALSATAMVFLTGGAIGLVSPDTIPGLAKPAVAWSLIGVGAVLDIAAVLRLLAARRSDARSRSP